MTVLLGGSIRGRHVIVNGEKFSFSFSCDYAFTRRFRTHEGLAATPSPVLLRRPAPRSLPIAAAACAAFRSMTTGRSCHYNDPSSIAVARNTSNQLNITNFVTLSDGEVIGGLPVEPASMPDSSRSEESAPNPPMSVFKRLWPLPVPERGLLGTMRADGTGWGGDRALQRRKERINELAKDGSHGDLGGGPDANVSSLALRVDRVGG